MLAPVSEKATATSSLRRRPGERTLVQPHSSTRLVVPTLTARYTSDAKAHAAVTAASAVSARTTAQGQ